MLAYQAVHHVSLTPVYPTIFKAKNGKDPYEPGLIEALSSPQSEQWTDVITEEITNLVKQWTWGVIQKYEVPEGAKIVPGTWDFKCKCFPNGSFRKIQGTVLCQRRNSEEAL